MQRKRAAMVGGFVLVGVVVFALGLFLVGDRRLLFTRQFETATTFGRVTGLVVGTPVRLAASRRRGAGDPHAAAAVGAVPRPSTSP